MQTWFDALLDKKILDGIYCAYQVIKEIPTHLQQNIITFVHCTAVVFLQPLKAHPYGNVSKLHVGLFWLDK